MVDGISLWGFPIFRKKALLLLAPILVNLEIENILISPKASLMRNLSCFCRIQFVVLVSFSQQN